MLLADQDAEPSCAHRLAEVLDEAAVAGVQTCRLKSTCSDPGGGI